MLRKIYIRPARPGLIIRYPETGEGPGPILPDEGAMVIESSFWLRRLSEGSVVKARTPELKGSVERLTKKEGEK